MNGYKIDMQTLLAADAFEVCSGLAEIADDVTCSVSTRLIGGSTQDLIDLLEKAREITEKRANFRFYAAYDDEHMRQEIDAARQSGTLTEACQQCARDLDLTGSDGS